MARTPQPPTPPPVAQESPPGGRWVRVQPWESLNLKPGEAVEGVYLGTRTITNGPHGAFDSLGLRTDDGRRFYTAHVQAISLVVENLVPVGGRIRLTLVESGRPGVKGALAQYVLDLWQERG